MGELHAKLVKIGNSRGVRLPRAVIEQAGLVDEVLILVRDREVILRPAEAPRAGWEKALLQHGPPDDADLEFLQAPNRFEDEEWSW
jgi:antitoxin MazE